ncbi:MAG: diguanylate cyclase [Solirubrobacterales bacterium]|nr:diguanylate cyclase [Solirubrobacterales bacterium]
MQDFQSNTIVSSIALDVLALGLITFVLCLYFELRDSRRRQSFERDNRQVEIDAKFFELSDDLALTIDFAGNIVSCNRAWTDHLGLSLEILRTEPFGSRIHPDDLADTPAAFAKVAAGGVDTEPFTLRFKHMDGSWRWLEWVVIASQEDELVFAEARDVTERFELQKALEIERSQLRSAQDIARIGSWHLEISSGEMFWSDATYELLGIAQPEGMPDAELWLSSLDPSEHARGQACLADAIINGGDFNFNFQRARPDANGEPIYIATKGFAEKSRDGRTTRLIGTIVDITERKRYEDGLQFIADHDPLTGLPNRRKFDEVLARHIAECERYGPRGALLMLDLDKLKEVNDGLGHIAGDYMIKAVADTLRERLRDTDVGARIGGDEFAILLTETTHEGARMLARSLIERLLDASPELRSAGVKHVTASIGIALVEDLEKIDPEALITAADEAMYAAKRQGAGNVREHFPRLRDSLRPAA